MKKKRRRSIALSVLLILIVSFSTYFLNSPSTATLIPKAIQKPNLLSIKKPTLNGVAKNKNIIAFQVEAFQNLCIGRSLFGHEITPNLNKLIKESYYFKNGISQVGFGNTSDAEFMLNTSIYPQSNKSPFKDFTNKNYVSLPKILKDNGYYTATFHTNDGSFWNRKNMYPILGFDKYYEKKSFPDEEKHYYGSSDRILFDKGINELKNFRDKGKPFYVNFVTLSSHAYFVNKPFMKSIKFGANYDKAIVGKYLAAINYTDRQLGLFIDALKAENLYDNSLILIYGDHFALTKDNMSKEYAVENKKMIETLLGRPYDKLDFLNIPIIIKLPVKSQDVSSLDIAPQTLEMVAGQIDFMPTILNLAGIKNTKGTMYGKDLFNTKSNSLGVRYYMPKGTIINKDGLYSGKYHISWNHIIDSKKATEAEVSKIRDLLKKSDAYLLQLPRHTK